MAREGRRQREGEEERARAAAARGGMVSGRTRTARGEGDGRDYSEVRARAPNGSQVCREGRVLTLTIDSTYGTEA